MLQQSSVEYNELDTPTRKRQESVGKLYMPSRRERLRDLLNGRFGLVLNIVNTILSVLACIMYLLEVYESDVYEKRIFTMIEVSFCVFFALDYIGHLYAAKNQMAFIFSFISIVDLLTILPVIVVVLADTTSVTVLVLLRIFRVFRALRILRLHHLIVSRKSGYDYELSVLIFSILATIFVAAGIFQALEHETYEREGLSISFHESLYFVLVTVSTVGYGDVVPHTTATKILVMALIVAIFTIVPHQVSKLNELSKVVQFYDKSYEPLKSKSSGHVIVSGHVTYDSMSAFLSEFFHESRGVINLHVVIVSNEVPSQAFKRLLSSVKYSHRTTYIRGSLISKSGQVRSKLQAAEAVFVLADKKAHDDEKTDATVILQSLSVRNAAESIRRKISLFVQLVSPEDKYHIATMVGATHVIDSAGLKSAILARGIVCHGACTLLMNLILSQSPAPYQKAGALSVVWMKEYVTGLSHQIYPFVLGPVFEGETFREAAKEIYTQYGVILFAMYNNSESRRGVMLNPRHRKLYEGDLCFLIAPCASISHLINKTYGTSKASSTPKITITRDTLLRRMSPRNRQPSFSFESSPPDSDLNIPVHPLPPQKYSISTTAASARLEEAIRETVDDLSGHVVICGSFLKFRALIALLSRFTHRSLKIVVLGYVPTVDEYRTLCCPRDVYFMEGLTTTYADLIRAGVLRAETVIIMPQDKSQRFDEDDEHLMDYGAVTTLLALETLQHELNPSVWIVTVLNRANNVRFCQPRDRKFSCDPMYCLNPSFASGRLYVDAQLDLLVCQSFFNPYIVETVHALAGSRCYTEESQHIIKVPVPASCDGQEFQEVFEYFLQESILPLGIYRMPRPGNDNLLPYVVACPRNDAVVYSGDSIFGIGLS